MGLTCCWDTKLISSVQTEHSQKLIQSQLKERQNQSWFTLSEEPSRLQWTTFYTLQLLDIYSTYRGLQYDCVKELNPIVGESPSVGRMFFVKTAILTPALEMDRREGNLTVEVFNEMNFLMSIVVANNIDQIGDAKKYCKKR